MKPYYEHAGITIYHGHWIEAVAFLPLVGIEIEERYCELAAKRLSQEVLELAEVPA